MSHQKKVSESIYFSRQSTKRVGRETRNQPHVVSANVFDEEIFKELCDLLGKETAYEALWQLAADLHEVFPKNPGHKLDLRKVSEKAHYLIGRTGILGFTSLSDASSELQEACKSKSQVNERYENACEKAQAACNAISIIKRQSA
jgi:HPt (histidine-containing phosphotransfer) domain-containing protein